MRQYFDAKRQYRSALLFFRMGDFYEMFYEDALVAARALELTLTSRSKDASGTAVPMCGVPHHAADTYITRLVRKGYRVAICEQVEDPRKAKGVVQARGRARRLARHADRRLLPGCKEPAFLMSVVATSGAGNDSRQHFGAALIDVSTGEFSVGRVLGSGRAAGAPGRDRRPAATRDRRGRRPRPGDVVARAQAERGIPVTEIEGWLFDLETARQTLLDQLRVSSLEGFGLERQQAAVCAAGALLRYLRDTQKADLAHVRRSGTGKRPTVF